MNDHVIEQRVRITARPEAVWKFWTDAQKLCEWWGSAAEVEPLRGGIFRVEMSPDGPVMRGEYLELEPHNRLVFSFGWENNALGELMAPGTTRVEVTLTAVGDDTDVHLVHSGLPAEQTEPHSQGWQLFVGERLPEAAAGTRS